MPYPEFLIAPMREELTDVGFTELRTVADVDRAVTEKGTTLVVVNSVCGCAAGKARPDLGTAMSNHPGCAIHARARCRSRPLLPRALAWPGSLV